MKEYQLLKFTQDRYIARRLAKENEAPAFIPFEGVSGEKIIKLPACGRKYDSRMPLIRIGENEGDQICIPGSGVQAVIIGDRLLIRKGEVFLNGRLCLQKEYLLIPGDRLFIGTAELVYGKDYIEINGDDTVATTLRDYLSEDPLFEEFPIYKRSPRIIKREPKTAVELQPPKEKSKPKKGELIKRILPSLVMLAATIAVSILMKRGIFILVMAATTVVTVAVSITTYIDDTKKRKQEEQERQENYTNYLLRMRKTLAEKTDEFMESRTYHNLSLARISEEVKEYSNRIYERNMNDGDFLTLRLGYGREMPSFKINCKIDEINQSKDPLYLEMLDVHDNFKQAENVPCVIDLKQAHLGIVGEKEYTRQRLKDIIVQLAFFQSYHDIQIITLTGEEDREDLEWLNWLPHCKVSSINVSGLVSGENHRDQVLGNLNQALKTRSQRREESKKESRYSPHYLFIADEPSLLMDHSIMEHLKEEGTDLGYSLIYTAHLRSNLPENIKTILMIDAEGEGRLLLNEGRLLDKKIFFEDTQNIDFEGIARRLAPLIHNKGVSTKIPDSIGFFELLKVKHPQELDIQGTWAKSASHKSLAVPLGVRGKNDIVMLDLHEKAHGPHGLVAGTTGSGKSEILQSYILSLALHFHPYEVGFLLIDYKGGGMANLFADLPHLLGTITNLDGSESMRALASIKSELARRQEIFGENGVNNINKYTEKFKKGEAKEPLPHLFIISDEFAELKKEQPDFMAELVSAARVGRSLGVHLILATQKPTGVVDDQIWSNSRFKLALKVQNESDSKEVLKTADAANITQPGRAILQVGNNEVYELFQSAYSGGTYSEEKEASGLDERIYAINELGQGRLINEDLSSILMGEESDQSQLDVTVEEIRKVYEKEKPEEVRRPWLPPLEEQIANPHISLEQIQDVGKIQTLDPRAEIGMVDMPDKQKQEEHQHDLIKDGNLAIFGAAGTGKSTVEMNLALSLAVKNSPKHLQYYVLDFGNSALFALKDLPHTADYINFDDEEKFRKLRDLLDEQMAERKRAFARENAISLDTYNRKAEEKLPVKVILIDNFDVVKEMPPEVTDFFIRLTRDGMSVGIYTVMTASLVSGIRYAIINNFKSTICNYMTKKEDVSATVGRSQYELKEIPGRGLVKREDVDLLQEYLPQQADNPMEYAEKIATLVENIRQRCSIEGAEKISMLSDEVTFREVIADIDVADKKTKAIGLDNETVKPYYLDRRSQIQIIMGPPQSGKTNAVRLILAQIKEGRIFIADARTRDLEEYGAREEVTYAAAEKDLDDFLTGLAEAINERETRYEQEGKGRKLKEYYESLPELSIFIEDIDNFIGLLGSRASKMTELVTRGLTAGARFYITSPSARFKGFDTLSKQLRDNTTTGFVFGDVREQGVFAMKPRTTKKEKGFAHVYENGIITLVKLPKME